METDVIILLISSLFWLIVFAIWLYGKYVAVMSLYNKKYQDKIDYLKSKPLYYPIWKYMEVMQIGLRFILKGEIK